MAEALDHNERLVLRDDVEEHQEGEDEEDAIRSNDDEDDHDREKPAP